ncbi:hypothetical protein D3C74_393730 [compost metagenome]
MLMRGSIRSQDSASRFTSTPTASASDAKACARSRRTVSTELYMSAICARCPSLTRIPSVPSTQPASVRICWACAGS